MVRFHAAKHGEAGGLKNRQDGMVFSSNKLAGSKKQAAQPSWLDLKLRRNVVPFNLDTLFEGESGMTNPLAWV